MMIVRKPLLMFIAATLVGLTACEDATEPVVSSDDSTPALVVEDTDVSVAGSNTSELAALPKDTGGSHKPYVLWSTAAKFGYYLYTPGGYSSTTAKYPLLIFLHGKSERGDGSSSLTVLNRVLNTGVPKQIKDGKWKTTYPMMVVSPQFYGTTGNPNNWGGGDPSHLKNFISYMVTHYRVDPKRIYLTGLSHGGNGVYDYISMTDDASNYIAAAAPVASYGAGSGFSKAKRTPIWTFVGALDATNFKTSQSFVTKYNAQVPAPTYKAKFTDFLNAGHDVWTRTYSGSGIGTANPAHDPFNQSLYDWFFKYKRAN